VKQSLDVNNMTSINRKFAVMLLSSVAGWCSLAGGANAQSPQASDSSFTGRTITAIGYRVNGGSTTVDLHGTGLMPSASGQAKVDPKPGITKVEVQVQGLTSPTQFGAEFLTCVLWAVSPEGHAVNLGEVLFNSNGQGQLKTTTQLASFSLFVSAEPYFAVRQPSEMLILENAARPNTKGRIFLVQDYKLMKRSQYQKLGNPLALSPDLKNVPLEMYEARNAVDIARSRGADKYAPEIFSKADAGLKQAENALASRANKKDIVSLARQAAQFSEDARALAIQRQDEELIAKQRAQAAADAKAEAEAKAAAEAAEAKRKADEEARRQAELAAAKEAELKAVAAAREAQAKAEAAAREAQMRADAAIAASKAKAEADALKAKEEAAKAEAERAQRAADDLRATLLNQFNRILETRDTTRGLVITMADVLFDSGKYDIRSGTREQLAKLSGIILAHPGLNLEIEGHTDNTGGDELNLKLSGQRADAVRTYLITQGLTPDSITTQGLGDTMPVASNDTSAGRQKNRRVEIIVSGESIGVKIGK
jgi:outer membrane protein OmpA-like peptidoglycan-associated protein